MFKPLAVGQPKLARYKFSKKIYILICFTGLGTITMARQLVVNQHYIMGWIYFQKIQSLDFFHHLSLENPENYWPIDTGLVKF